MGQTARLFEGLILIHAISIRWQWKGDGATINGRKRLAEDRPTDCVCTLTSLPQRRRAACILRLTGPRIQLSQPLPDRNTAR
jgi:hypothetical protein